MNLTDIYRAIHPTEAECTFFSSTHRIFFQDKSYVMSQKSLEFKKNEIISSIFSSHNFMKLEINNRRKSGIFTNMWKLTHF